MSEADRDFGELKREIVEARNQAIKTDNQVKNLSLDVKGFEKRFDALERRTRLASVGVHAIVAVTIVGAALVVSAIRQKSHDEELAVASMAADTVRQTAGKKEKQLAGRLRDLEAAAERRNQAEKSTLAIFDHLENRRDKEAADLMLKTHVEELSPLGQALVDERLADLRRRTSDAAYRAGRSLLSAGREEQAVAEFARCLRFDPDGTHAEKARYLQSTTLYSLRRYDQAEPLLRQLRDDVTDSQLLDEVRFLLGTSLARLGRREEAKSILKKASKTGRYQAAARQYLAALEGGSPLPGDNKTN